MVLFLAMFMGDYACWTIVWQLLRANRVIRMVGSIIIVLR
jgi:hypothetical protein